MLIKGLCIANLPNGPKLLDEYHEISPGIIAKIKSKPNSQEIFQDILENDIREAVSMIEDGRYAGALIKYANMTNRLNAM